MRAILFALAFVSGSQAATAFSPAAHSPLFRAGAAATTTKPTAFVKGSVLQKAVEVDGGDQKSDDDEGDMMAILVVDKDELEKSVAQNWGFILNEGVLSLIGGALALCVPTLASAVAYEVVTYTVAALAAFNVLGLFMAEEGFRIPSLIVGILQGFLAYRMWQMPFTTMTSLTYLVSGTCIFEGAWQGAVAIKNRKDLPQWGWRLASGLVSIAGGAYAISQMPIWTLVVPGIALGFHLVSAGALGISIALAGRESANEKIG